MRDLHLLLFFLLAGCAVGPDYSRRALSTPDKFRIAEAAHEAESFANLPWWDLLQDEELQRLIRTALGENKDLKRAVASVEEFQSRLFISKMDFAPKADVTVNAPSFGRKASFLFPGFPNPFNYYLQGISPGNSTFGGAFAGPMRRREVISWRAKKLDARRFSSS
jgi:outer membrane protein, multidrug efflux system